MFTSFFGTTLSYSSQSNLKLSSKFSPGLCLCKSPARFESRAYSWSQRVSAGDCSRKKTGTNHPGFANIFERRPDLRMNHKFLVINITFGSLFCLADIWKRVHVVILFVCYTIKKRTQNSLWINSAQWVKRLLFHRLGDQFLPCFELEPRGIPAGKGGFGTGRSAKWVKSDQIGSYLGMGRPPGNLV